MPVCFLLERPINTPREDLMASNITLNRNLLATTFAAELGACISILGFGPSVWMTGASGWESWTLSALALCLGVMTASKMIQSWVLGAEDEGVWRRKVAIGFGVSLLGWIGLIALFALRIISPDLEVHVGFYFVAFATHISGALYALKQLGRI